MRLLNHEGIHFGALIHHALCSILRHRFKLALSIGATGIAIIAKKDQTLVCKPGFGINILDPMPSPLQVTTAGQRFIIDNNCSDFTFFVSWFHKG